jgi:hypothetical protein
MIKATVFTRFRISRKVIGIGFILLISSTVFAGTNLIPVVDFHGDGKSDVSVFRPSDRYWYIRRSLGDQDYIRWGLDTDKPVPGDYDGDGRTDVAVHRKLIAFPETGTWWVMYSQDHNYCVTRWASNNIGEFDIPVPADYDGDGETDLAYYRLSDQVG